MNEKNKIIYHYKKDRKQRSIIFINMAITCLVYIAGLYVYEYSSNKLAPENFRTIYITSFTIGSLILFYIAYWHRCHPAIYEAIITTDRLIVKYPESRQWSFDIKISEIKRFEHRNTHSHAGKGIGQSGVLLIDGSFHEISMNYGNSIKEMYNSVKSINPDITFPRKVNKN